uniref:PHD-type domain-containing protein n=1 Tax=Arundo donax TaxID=35708 RepID=A0A0A9EC26_ARUDO
MIQCCICEDWFHENHIDLNSIEEIPRDEEGEPLYEDFICHKCSPVCCFLKLYPDTIWASSTQNSASQADKTYSNVTEGPSGHDTDEKHENGVLVDHMGSEKASIEDNGTNDIVVPEKANLNGSSGSDCKLGMDISAKSADSEKNVPFFMSKGWRDTLCRCEACTNFYAQQGITYLIDKDDSIERYEKIAKQKRKQKLEQQEGAETNFLNSLNHVQKIEILSGINDMKNEFQSFLESFDPSKPVTSEDIRAVFENLAKKKQRLS